MVEASVDQDVFRLGRYQYRMIFLLGLPILLHGCQVMNVVFILAEPKHRCELPGWADNDTYAIQGDVHRDIIDDTIPITNDVKDEAKSYSQCTYFVSQNTTFLNSSVLPDITPGYTNTSHLGNGSLATSESESTSTERHETTCHSWAYDKEDFSSTVVSEMNLVCDRSLWQANAAMIFMLGHSIGSTFGGVLSDSIGRKKVYFLSLVPMLIGGVGQALSPTFVWFMALRLLSGIGNGVIFIVFFVLSMELIDTSHRGIVGIVPELFWVSGITLYGGLAFAIRNWRHLQLVISIPLVTCFILWRFVPESPRWLVTKGRIDDAETEMKKISRVNKTQWSPTNLQQDNAEKTGETDKLWHLLTDKTLLARAVVVFINWIVIAMLFYGLAMNLQNLGGNLYLNYLLSCLSEAFAYCVSLWAIGRCGRKVFHCSVMLLGGVACVTAVFPITFGGSGLRWLTITLAMVGKFGVSAAFACIYIYTSELFPTSIRSATVGTSSVLARIGSIVSPYIAQLATIVGGRSGRVIPMLVFGLSAIVAGLLSLFLPETRSAPLPDTVKEARSIGRVTTTTADTGDKDDNVAMEPLNKAN